MKKYVIAIIALVVLVSLPAVFAGLDTYVGFPGSVQDATSNESIGTANITINISTQNSCTVGVIYNETFVDGVQDGVYSVLLGYNRNLSLNYNQDYYSCVHIDNGSHSETFGADVFRGGQGLIEPEDINDTATYTIYDLFLKGGRVVSDSRPGNFLDLDDGGAVTLNSTSNVYLRYGLNDGVQIMDETNDRVIQLAQNGILLQGNIWYEIDVDKRIEFNTAANQFRFYPSGNNPQNYIIMQSDGTIDQSPVLYPSANNEGRLGSSGRHWHELYINRGYFQPSGDDIGLHFQRQGWSPVLRVLSGGAWVGMSTYNSSFTSDNEFCFYEDYSLGTQVIRYCIDSDGSTIWGNGDEPVQFFNVLGTGNFTDILYQNNSERVCTAENALCNQTAGGLDIWVNETGDTMTGALTITKNDSYALLIEQEDSDDIFRVDTAAATVYSVLLRPNSDNAYDLGMLTRRWRNLFVMDVNVSDDLLVNGESTLVGNTSINNTVFVEDGRVEIGNNPNPPTTDMEVNLTTTFFETVQFAKNTTYNTIGEAPFLQTGGTSSGAVPGRRWLNMIGLARADYLIDVHRMDRGIEVVPSECMLYYTITAGTLSWSIDHVDPASSAIINLNAGVQMAGTSVDMCAGMIPLAPGDQFALVVTLTTLMPFDDIDIFGIHTTWVTA